MLITLLQGLFYYSFERILVKMANLIPDRNEDLYTIIVM